MSFFLRRHLWRLVKPVLFFFDPEIIHDFAVGFLKIVRFLGPLPIKMVSGSGTRDIKPCSVLGTEFRSRVGLAAGFDKDAEIIRAIPYLGFGFVEIGTVTPRPQPGNPRPRLMRAPEKRALFNRMGFNGKGAEAAARNLKKAKGTLPAGFRVGVNIGKNKDTPLECAADDYVKAAAYFEDLADYLVINISSPNTPGLRSLQTGDTVGAIASRVNALISRWKTRPPLLLKLAPEVSGDDLESIMKHGEAVGIDGWVLTNTLGGKWPLKASELEGGWSGAPLTERALDVLRKARGLTQKTIISVGGIMSAEDAKRRIEAGADLVQIYTGWIYSGPSFPVEVARYLSLQ
jgi:dihydroorotate dehydrogenase